MRFKFLILASLLSVGGAVFVPQISVMAESKVTAEQLLQVQAGIAGQIQGMFSSRDAGALKDPGALQGFYLGRNYEPFWVSKSRVKSNGRDLIGILEESWSHGLNPYSFHLEEIEALQGQRDENARGRLDVLLSDAYLRLSQDLTGIRVDPRFMKSHPRFWKKPLTGDFVMERLDQERSIDRLVASYEPSGQTYKRLRKELMRLVETAPAPYEAVLPIRMRGALHPYQRNEAVTKLRQRLGVTSPNDIDPYVYDDKLAAAVIAFQRENGLKDDGILGPQTLDILNQTREHKITQILANLERLRWVEEEKPNTFVTVNIPSARLWAVENGQVQFEMPVIVGRKKRPTNVFITEIHGVRLNPDWTVPPTIKKEDIVPKLQEDPTYLLSKGMELISGRGEEAMTLDPSAFDWANITEEELKAIRMVQVPGSGNPLGRYRVLMPNSYNIYLHDTNERHKFNRANRALSSGCIRMEAPERMAHFILKNRPGWSEEALVEKLADNKTRDLFIQEPIPVYLLYYTAWLDTDNEVIYGQDLYGFDADLIKMLRDIDGIFIPVDNT